MLNSCVQKDTLFFATYLIRIVRAEVRDVERSLAAVVVFTPALDPVGLRVVTRLTRAREGSGPQGEDSGGKDDDGGDCD